METLKGRKRFLANIKFGNSKEKSKAERQAVNSICQVGFVVMLIPLCCQFLNENLLLIECLVVVAAFQGSAADIIKIAMINLHSALVQDVSGSNSSSSLERFPHLKGRCRILLQVFLNALPPL